MRIFLLNNLDNVVDEKPCLLFIFGYVHDKVESVSIHLTLNLTGETGTMKDVKLSPPHHQRHTVNVIT